MKEQMLGSEAIAKYDSACSKWALKHGAAMETANNVPHGQFSKYFDLKEDTWESALTAVVPGKFIELNKKAFNLGKNS